MARKRVTRTIEVEGEATWVDAVMAKALVPDYGDYKHVGGVNNTVRCTMKTVTDMDRGERPGIPGADNANG